MPPYRSSAILRLVASIAVLALPRAAALAAQSPSAAAQRPTVLQGIVFDSLISRRPLADAEIWIEGTELATRSDAKGRWHLDSVPSGRLRIAASHPRLDSLGFSAPVRVIDVTGLPSAFLTLATPAGRTVFERQCPGPQPRASGVLLGTVTDVEKGSPVAGAEVAVAWVEWQIGRKGVGQGERTALAVSDASGRFRVCGVPNDVPIALTAAADGRMAGPIEVHLRQREVATAGLQLAEAADAVPAVLAGRVVTGSRAPLADAEIRILGGRRSVRSSSDGRFTLGELPPGTHTMEVRAIGYAPRRMPVVLRSGETAAYELAMERTAVVVPELVVNGRAPARDLTGFEIRRRGGRGYFMDEEQIRQRHVTSTADLFVGIPGVQVVMSGANGVVLFQRSAGGVGKYPSGACYPQLYVDGMPRYTGIEDPATGDLIAVGRVINQQGLYNPDVGPGQLVRPEEIAAIEVYRGTADAPPEFSKYDSGCGVIVMWTRRGKPNSWYRDQELAEAPADPLPERAPQ